MEDESCPARTRFAGWWAAVWLNKLRCIQLGRADSHAVGRSVGLQDEATPGARTSALRDAAVFVTTRDDSLAEALEAEVPTILVRDGDPRFDLPPPLVHRFDPERIQILYAESCSRRELTLTRLQQSIERFAPGSCRRDGGESQQCRKRLSPYLTGAIADLGHGACKIRDNAVGVDVFRYDQRDWIGDVRDMHFFADSSFDSVYSSHCLEDLWDPHQALDEWLRILKPGGHLSLYLPMRGYYPSVGSPDANPGHKDDYVPEDVEGFLRDVGGCELVRSERFEEELSFEIVARRGSSKTLFFAGDEHPAASNDCDEDPRVSVLIAGQAGIEAGLEAQSIRASVTTAQIALREIPHEILVLLRDIPDADNLAALRDLSSRDARVRIVEDLRPLPYAQRIHALAQHARASTSIVLASGTVCLEGSLDELCQEIRDAKSATQTTPAPVLCPRVVDTHGHALSVGRAAATCIRLSSEILRSQTFAQSPYSTPMLFAALATQSASFAWTSGVVIGDGLASYAGRGLGRLRFDRSLAEQSVAFDCASPTRILVSILRTMGDAILATSSLSAIASRWPGAQIDILTESCNAWVFEHHPAVSRVFTCEDASTTASEEAATEAALRASDADRYVLMTTRSDNAPYNAAGDLRLAEYYAVQAGLDAASARGAPELYLSESTYDGAQRSLSALGVKGPYAVLHTKAGWRTKSLLDEQCQAITDAIAAEGLPVVVIGGPGELVPHPRALNLAGMLAPEASAAVIAGALVYAGPDSGCLHVASSFGVPSLALYAGSHPRVAPPLAIGSESALASTSCARPCGNACGEGSCSMRGISAEELSSMAQRLIVRARSIDTAEASTVADKPDPVCYFRGAPVEWISGPRGSERPIGERKAPPITADWRGQARRRLPAERRADCSALELTEEALQTAASHARVLPESGGPRLHTSRALKRTLELLRRRDRMSTSIAMAKSAIDRADSDLALAYLLRAAREVQEAIDGHNGRARPAFASFLDTLFAYAATVPDQGSVPSLDRILSFWSEHIESSAPARYLLIALSGADLEKRSSTSQSWIRRALESIDTDTLSAFEFRTCTRAMAQLGMEQEAADRIAQRLRGVTSLHARASLSWDRIPWLLQSADRAVEALESLQLVAEHSKDPRERVLSSRLLEQIQTIPKEVQL